MRIPAIVAAAVAALASGVMVGADAGISLTDVSAAAGAADARSSPEPAVATAKRPRPSILNSRA